MFIERVHIEEGFLDGLDVTLSPGLNAIIGARGTGKTSLIELIKYCLGVKGNTAESAKRSLEHALSVLGSGQVTVVISDGVKKISVSRTRSDEGPRKGGEFKPPLVFSQTEIETVGLQARGRLGLINSFVERPSDIANETEAVSAVRSLTAEVASGRREIEELKTRIGEIATIDAELLRLAPSEQGLSKLSDEAKIKKTELDALSAELSRRGAASQSLSRFTEALTRWKETLETTVRSVPAGEPWPDVSGPDPLIGVRGRLALANEFARRALAETAEALSEVAALSKGGVNDRVPLEERFRALRKELEVLQEGAGVIARKGQQLRERKTQLQGLQAIASQRETALAALISKRDTALDALDQIRDDRFGTREEIVAMLNSVLSPRIRITITRSGQFEEFAAAVSDALKGSGLKYNDLAPVIASNISPRELLEAVEADDVFFILESTGISADRATRLLSALRQSDLGSLSTVPVEDSVNFRLLDGSDYKDLNALSTGQRCTVILPIILRHTSRILIVDQPEDHIDNAFIADTLIQSLLARGASGQIIFSTHNANIPVLGEANYVLQLGSDGKRGFVITANSLDTPEVVSAITSVMEGGTKAFQQRSAFYGRFLPK